MAMVASQVDRFAARSAGALGDDSSSSVITQPQRSITCIATSLDFRAGTGVAFVAEDLVVVSDARLHCLQVFDARDGRLLRRVGEPGLVVPTALAAAAEPGHCWVLDAGRLRRLQCVDVRGDWPGVGVSYELQLVSPTGLAVDTASNVVYVVDDGLCTVTAWDGATGALRATLGGFDTPLGSACASGGGSIAVNARRSELLLPSARGGCVDVFSAETGVFLRTLGDVRRGQPCGVGAIAVSPEGTVLVADRSTHRVCMFTMDGTMQAYGTKGSAPGQFSAPCAVACSASNVAIVDSGNLRVQVF